VHAVPIRITWNEVEMAGASGIPPERLEHYDRLIATLSGAGIARKGAKVPYTSINGHMFSYLDPDGSLALRLPAGEREQFIEHYDTHLHEAYGIVQKEYVTVPAALLPEVEQLAPYFAASFAYVSALKPKPTTRRPAGATGP
jgi:hypothetical protein